MPHKILTNPTVQDLTMAIIQLNYPKKLYINGTLFAKFWRMCRRKEDAHLSLTMAFDPDRGQRLFMFNTEIVAKLQWSEHDYMVSTTVKPEKPEKEKE